MYRNYISILTAIFQMDLGWLIPEPPFWILFKLRMMEVVVTTGVIRRAKLQSNRHHQQTNTRFFTGWILFLLPSQQCRSSEGKVT